MKTKIAVLLPTRNKPEELRRVILEIEGTRALAGTKLYAYVAEDDPQLEAYKKLRDHFQKIKREAGNGERGILNAFDFVNIYIGEPLGFSRGQNFLAAKAIANGAEMVMRCEDDFYFIQKGWDAAYLEALPEDGIGMVWCNYVLKGKNAEPHTGAVGAEWYRALGFFSLPALRHYWCDNVLAELAKEIGRAFYIETPYINHRHSGQDPRKAESPNMANWEADTAAHHIWHDAQDGLKLDAEKLRACMKP